MFALRFASATSLTLVLGACSSLPLPNEGGDLQDKSDRIAADLARIRDLPLQQNVPASTRDKDDLRATLVKEIDENWVKEGDGIERAYKLFGLVPPDLDLKPYMTEFLKEQIAGYYDPDEKRFYTIDEKDDDDDDDDKGDGEGEEGDARSSSDNLSFILAHELTHAIDDQHFDLDAMRERHATDEDRSTALSALTEGAAMEAGLEYTLWRPGLPLSTAGLVLRTLIRNLIPDDPMRSAATLTDLADDNDVELQQLQGAPPVLRAELLLPYLQGWRFVNRLRSEFGWRAVDDAYRDPPESTEQILHPERYIDRRDRPVKITLPPPPSGYRAVYEGALGSFRLAILLGTALGEDLVDVADGWDGDRFVVWETETGDALGWVLAFDREGQAEDFESVYRVVLDYQYDPRDVAVKRRDNVVTAVLEARDGRADELATALLDSTIEVAEDDQSPDRWYGDLLRFPISLRLLDRVVETRLLGGLALDLRSHDGGHRFRLLDSIALHSENNPDRSALWVALGLVGFDRDRTLDSTYWHVVPGVLGYHGLGEGANRRASFSMLFDAIEYRNITGTKDLSVLWGLLFRGRWGEKTVPGRRFRVLLIPLPGL